VDEPAQIEITKALNQLLSRGDLYSPQAWHDTALSEALRKELSRREPRTPQDVRRRNRLLLEGTFPQHIRPPPPIISPQLLIAFTLLGLFPLLIKRLVSRGGVRTPQQDSNRV
jgi:hypothetical protein